MSLVTNTKTPLFKDEDFQDWSFRFKYFLKGKKLWSIIDKTKSQHLGLLTKRVGKEKFATLDPDQIFSDQQDEVTSYLAEAMIGKPKLAIIRSSTTPKKMWEALQNKYEGRAIKSEAITQAQRKELDFKLKDYNGDMEAMIRAIDENAELLNSLGAPSSNQLTILLRALEESPVEEVRTTATSLRIAGKDYDGAKPILIQLNQRRKAQGLKETSSRPDALMTSNKSSDCRSWIKTGKCSNRQRCRWSHPPNMGSKTHNPTTRRSLPKDKPPNANNICRNFQKGICKRTNCRYHHVRLKCSTCEEFGHSSKECKAEANLAEPEVYSFF